MSLARRLAISIIAAAIPLAAHAGTFTTLYTFTGGKDGGFPFGPLLYQDGELYGTTIDGYGNVYKVNAASGDLKVVYRFKGGTDGQEAAGGVIYQNGMLYGTTWFGGGGCQDQGPGKIKIQGCGTIFSINAKTGVETVLYSFYQDFNNTSGAGAGPLVYQAGTLYGAAVVAGASSYGSVFGFNLGTGTFATLHSFGGGTDGVYPNRELLYQNGLFYGTTLYGGGSGNCIMGGCGTLFSIDPATGDETILNVFTPKRGRYPNTNLVYHGGSFFGAAEAGGSKACKHGCGVSYKVKAATGHETVLETFQSLAQSYSGITIVGGNAYETLPSGGSGAGELLEVDLKTGQQTVLYTFTGGTDGSDPQAQLTYHDGAFYGTTIGGAGSVFKFVP